MAEERKQNRDQSGQDNKLPEEVLNATQDPNSIKDPLKAQLEKSKDLNGPVEERKLEELKEKYGHEGQEPMDKP
jgi:hypothetical protein